MAFYKNADSNFNLNIVEVMNEQKCEKCERSLNLLKSKNGIVICDKCGFENKLSENKNGL